MSTDATDLTTTSYPAMDAAYNFLSQQKLRHKEGEETFPDMLAPDVLKQTNEFDILYSDQPHQMQIALLEGDAKKYFDADLKQHYLFMPSQKVTVNTMNRINHGLIKTFLRIKPNKPDWGLASKHIKKVNVSRSYDLGAFRIWYQSPASFNNWLGFVAVVPLGKDDQAPRWSNMALINISLITDWRQLGGDLYPHFGEDAYSLWKTLQTTGLPQSINVNIIEQSGYHRSD